MSVTATVDRDVTYEVRFAIVVGSVARLEAVRALRHPVTLLGAAASVLAMWAAGWDVAPVLERESVFLGATLLPLAAASFLVGFWAVSRQRSLPELLAAAPASRDHRLLGVHLGMLGPGLLAIALQVVAAGYLLTGDPIGQPLWWELGSGPAMIWALGVAGATVARFLPHPMVAPAALAGLALLEMLAARGFQLFEPGEAFLGLNWLAEPVANLDWLVPWLPVSVLEPPDLLLQRPSALHCIYLLAAVALLSLVGLRGSVGRTWVKAGAASTFVAGVVGVSISLTPTTELPTWWEIPQVCETHDGTQYCAFSIYQGWIPHWQATVAAVDEVFPVDVKRVLQRPHNIGWEEPGVVERPGTVLVTTHWDRARALPEQRLVLALGAARSAVGLPTTQLVSPSLLDEGVEPESAITSCTAAGQARAVVVIWTAATVVDNGGEAVRHGLEWSVRGEDARRTGPHAPFYLSGGPWHPTPAVVSRADAELALRLLEQPHRQVRQALQERWSQVRDPATTSRDVADWFGLVAPAAPRHESQLPTCP